MKLWVGLLLCGLVVLTELLASWWLTERVKAETERRIWAEVSDYVAIRAKDQTVFQGFDEATADRINRVSQDFYLNPAILAALARQENGWLQNQTGYNGWTKAKVRRMYPDPEDWPYACAADLFSQEAMKFVQGSDHMGLWFTKVGKRYNITPLDWTLKVTDLALRYSAEREIPVVKPAVKAKAKRGKR